MDSFSEEATAYYDAHLADDPLTQKMLARLDMIADELEAAGLESAIGAAKFLGALDKCGAGSSAELPFELDETTREIIDGSKSSPAMREHCTSDQTRGGAAVLNTVNRACRGKTSYRWADELMREGPLKTYAQVSLSLVDDQLAGVALALNHELRLLPRLDTQQAPDSGQEHQTVALAALAIFWAADDGVHCGVTQRHGARWARVVEFARDNGYPVHAGFHGEVLDDEQLDEVLGAIEEPSISG